MLSKSFAGIIAASLLSAFAVLGTTAAQAQTTQNDSFDVTATIIASCTISATDMVFGNYDPLSVTPVDQTSTISVTCTNGAPYTIALDGGLSGNVAARTMDDDTAGTSFLSYQLYHDATHTTLWGDSGANDHDGTCSGSNQNITVYGRIPAGQTTPVIDSYTDTIVATVSY